MPATQSLTRLFKTLREEKREQVIENLLFDYPYLISADLASPQRQVRLDPRSRADLLFYLPNKVVVVEIKRGVIAVAAVQQISRYLALAHQNHRGQVQGYLVGTSITPGAEKMCEKSPWQITFRRLGLDIPRSVVFCRQCRKARDQAQRRCPHDRCLETD